MEHSLQPADIYRQMVLENGIVVEVRDLTKNYFGDYYLVRLEITCRSSANNNCPCNNQASSVTTVPETVFRRVVEKMGVPSREVAGARDSLIENFLDHSLAYLSAADFPAKLAASACQPQKRAKPKYAERKV